MRSIKILTSIQWVCLLYTAGTLVFLLTPSLNDGEMCLPTYVEKEHKIMGDYHPFYWDDKISDDPEEVMERHKTLPGIFNEWIQPSDRVPPSTTNKPGRTTIYNWNPPGLYIIPEPTPDPGKVCNVSEPPILIIMLLGTLLMIGIGKTTRQRK